MLIYKGRGYNRERIHNNNEYWRCLKTKCKSRIVVKNGKIVKYREHNWYCSKVPNYECEVAIIPF